MAKFRVLAGLLSEGGKTYSKGDIVESKNDLTKHNRPGSYKFERLPDEPEAVFTHARSSRTADETTN